MTEDLNNMEVNAQPVPDTSKLHQAKLRSAIMLSIDLDGAFRLYSFRCIGPEAFIERTNNLVETYQATMKALEPKKETEDAT